MKFTGEKCLVCQNTFTDDDDIVVCPECGTPHHRECWFANGCCVNAERHADGYEYTLTAEPESKKEDAGETAPAGEHTFFSGAEGAPFESPFDSEYFTEEEIKQEGIEKITVGGSDVRYYIAALGKNCSYYLNRFLVLDEHKKAMLFNPMAFLFPFAWSIYRKMYKAAAVVLALYLGLTVITALPVVTNEELIGSFNEVIAENPENIAESISNINMYLSSNGSVQLTEKQAAFVTAYAGINTPVVYIVFVYLYSFALHSAGGLLATKLYYKKIRKRVLSVEQNGSLTFREKIAELVSKKPTVPFIIAAVIGIFEFGLIQL